jgi:uncharacterized protein (DUF305 family)
VIRYRHLFAFAAPLVLAACASTAPVPAESPADAAGPAAAADHAGHQPAQPVLPADPQHDAHAAHGQLAATAGPGYSVADVRFMQHMIGHHAQALVMAAMAPSHGASEHFLRLVEKIEISQTDEIGLMKQWLTERKQAVPDDTYMHGMMMPGMLTPEQLQQLDAARGREFERLFLTFMIRHHEGALQMVDELFDTPGAGQDPDIFRFATDVDADQRDEIYTMSVMLDMLENPARSPAR